MSLPEPLPTCHFPSPPVCTVWWDAHSWRKWAAAHCLCYGHRSLRSQRDDVMRLHLSHRLWSTP